MSFALLPLVWSSILPTTEKIVLLRLADFGDDNGENVRPSLARVARDCGLTDRAVRHAMRSLEGQEIIVCLAKPAGRPWEYRINRDRLTDNISVDGTGCGSALEAITPEPRSAHPGTTFPIPRNHIPHTPEIGSPLPGTTFPTPRNHVPHTPEPRSANPLDTPYLPLKEKTDSPTIDDDATEEVASSQHRGEGGLDQLPAPRLPYPGDLAAEFGEFWSAYPRRVAKGSAMRAYQAATRHTSASTILAGARAYALQVEAAGTAERFVKHPATWLNGACWLDENAPPPPASPKPIERVRRPADRSDDQWRGILRHWARMGCRPEYWQWRNGGMPGLGGCVVPAHVRLEEEFKGMPWGSQP